MALSLYIYICLYHTLTYKYIYISTSSSQTYLFKLKTSDKHSFDERVFTRKNEQLNGKIYKQTQLDISNRLLLIVGAKQ